MTGFTQAPDVALLGRLEAVIDGRALGWAFDSSAPGRRVALELLVDGKRVGRVVADLTRPSLVRDGVGDGRHAFAVNLPGRLRDGVEHAIALLLPTGEPLPVSHPLQVHWEDAPEWSQARLTADSQAPGTPVGVQSEVRAAGVIEPLSEDLQRSLRLRLRPCDEAHFLRREPVEGFSGIGEPETIFMSENVRIDRPDPVRLAVQPGVADPLGEREGRLGRDGSYLARRAAICRLPNAIVDTSAFMICPDEHHYLSDSVRGYGLLPWFGYSPEDDGSVVRDVEGVAERGERVVVLGAQTNYNFSHWLLESVARALLFRPFDDGSWQYLTPKLNAWQRQTLKQAGVPADRIIEVEPGGPVRFREVIAVSRAMSTMSEFIPAGIDALAALASGPAQREPAPWGRRLYISRERSNVRRVSNESAVAELFERHGFLVVCPETLPFDQQLELLGGAEVVAGPHGSGMTGALFSSPGTLVVELAAEQQRSGVTDYLWNLCAARNQRFAQVVCRFTPGMDEVPLAHRDITVDLPGLDKLLSAVLPG